MLHRRTALTLSLLLVSPAAFAQFPGAKSVPDDYAAGFNSITPEDSKELLTKLVSKDFGGRGSGQEGFAKAAKWYSKQLEKYGFQPAGTDGSWFQQVPLLRVGVRKETQLRLAGKPVDVTFGMGTYQGQTEASGDIVFLNLKSADAELNASALEGKIVVYRVAQSGRRRFRSAALPPSLRSANVAALIRVTGNAPITDRVGRVPQLTGKVPSLSVSVDDANKVAASCALSDKFFSETPDRDTVVTAAADAKLTVDVVRETVDVPNVIGWYPGSDPELQHEHVGLGAHLDHLGMRGDAMYPGADDNGSGSTALLQIAKAIHTNPVKPKRSIFLIVFCGEELGLLGSRHYVDHATRPLKDMVCMLNIDMIGRNEEKANEPASENVDTIHLVGSKRISMALHELTLKANQHIGFKFEYDEEGVYTRSDHASFAKKGIPITFIFGGFNPHYHKTTDTIEGINFNKIVSGAKLNYLCAMMAAKHGHFEKNEE